MKIFNNYYFGAQINNAEILYELSKQLNRGSDDSGGTCLTTVARQLISLSCWTEHRVGKPGGLREVRCRLEATNTMLNLSHETDNDED